MKYTKFAFYLIILTFLVLPVISRATDCSPTGNTGDTAVCNPNPSVFVNLDLVRGNYGNTFGGLLLFIIQSALGIVGLLAVVFIIIGGFQYITSRGNEEQAEAGKKSLTNAIIGLVIVILSYMIVAIIVNAVNGRA